MSIHPPCRRRRRRPRVPEDARSSAARGRIRGRHVRVAEEFLSSPPRSAPIGLLLDVHLGGMSGLDLQRRLRNEGSTIPVIIITAFDDARSREQAERLGCVAYLRKPCEAETILALLCRLARD